MKKSYIVIVIIFVIYTAIMCLVFGNRKNKDDTKFLVNNSIFTYKNDKWDISSFDNETYAKLLFNVYINNEYQGKFYLRSHNDKWYYFDDNNESYDFYGSLFATGEKVSTDVINFNESSASLSEVTEILSSNDLSINSLDELTQNKKISFDFDSDGDDETIYSLSNLTLNVDSDNVVLFSIVVYSDNDKLTTIINDNGTISSKKVNYFYSIDNIFKLNNEKNYKMLVRQEKIMNAQQQCDSLYEVANKSLKLLKAC